mgnify:CR=1 FL=1
MVDAEYANAFYEVLEILKYIDIDDYEKISPDLIKTFQTYANWDWNFEYDVNKTLNEQNISKITKAIIANIEEIYKFAAKIKTMPECKNLTSEEKQAIIFSYPFKIEII